MVCQVGPLGQKHQHHLVSLSGANLMLHPDLLHQRLWGGLSNLLQVTRMYLKFETHHPQANSVSLAECPARRPELWLTGVPYGPVRVLEASNICYLETQ